MHSISMRRDRSPVLTFKHRYHTVVIRQNFISPCESAACAVQLQAIFRKGAARLGGSGAEPAAASAFRGQDPSTTSSPDPADRECSITESHAG